jgi:hypothetical protein
VNNIKMDLREIGWDGMESDQWRALVNTATILRVSHKFWKVLAWQYNWPLVKKGSAP